MVKMTTTEEQLLGVIAQEPGAEMPEGPFVTVVEQLLKKIADNGGGGGGGLAPEIIYAESHTTKEGYVIPVLTDTQITAAYNAIVAGKVVLVVDDLDTLSTQIYDASSIDGLAIRGIFTDTLILTYHIGGDIDAVKFEGGGGGSEPAIKTLSSADYNWPVDNPTSVALWLLDDGIYSKPDDVSVKMVSDTFSPFSNAQYYNLFVVSTLRESDNKRGVVAFSSAPEYTLPYSQVYYETFKSNGLIYGSPKGSLGTAAVYDGIDSSSTARALSANQGRVLKGLIDALIFQNVITLSGTSGTLTDDQFALATDESKMVIIKIGNKVFRRGGSGTSWINYINTTTPTDTTVEFTNLYINTDSTAVNYKSWSTEVVTPAGGGGGVKVLTADDYNYPENNPEVIATWLLDNGNYDCTGIENNVIWNDNYGRVNVSLFTIIRGDNAVGVISAYSVNIGFTLYQSRTNGKKIGDGGKILTSAELANNLTTITSGLALDARQGKTLKDLIDSLIIKGTSAPTTSTVGTVGQLYEDTTNGELYQCTAVSEGTYTWEKVGGGGGVNVVQSTGTSTTDVMSQDAVTKVLFADGNTRRIRLGSISSAYADYTIQLGENASAYREGGIAIGQYAGATPNSANGVGTAIGKNAKVTTDGSNGTAIGGAYLSGTGATTSSENGVAVGSYSKATTKGEFNIGDGTSTALYNNTGYRLLTGVHDGQSNHDAVNVEQINALIDAINTAASLNIAHIGNTGA